LDTGPNDLFVLARDGDLELWPDAITGSPAPPVTIVDYPDPFGVVNEGSGPNVIGDVAGEIGGTVVFADCCEPVAGNIRVATATGDVRTVGVGSLATRSPQGDLLGTANDFQISQTSTRDAGNGLVRPLDRDTSPHVVDLTWTWNGTATAADDHLVLVGWTLDDGWSLYDIDRTTLEPTKAFELGIAPVPEAPDVAVRFAGTGPDGEIVVAESTSSTTRLRYFAPTTLAELGAMERSLPASATSIRVSQDDLLWVDRGDELYFLPGGTLDPIRLGDGVIAAWAP
jgi:hypothetical protein